MQRTAHSSVLKRRSLVQKILQADSPQSLMAELNKVLKEEPALRVAWKEIVRTAARYKVDLHRKFGRELQTSYARFLKRCLSNGTLTTKEKDSLHHLKILFGLSDRTVERIHDRVAQSIYRKSVEKVLADKKLKRKERSFLKALQRDLKLPDWIAEKIYRDEAALLMQRAFVEALSDSKLSPQEEEELHTIARTVGATLEFDEKTKAALNKYRLYWLIENGEIPALQTEIQLQPKEKCYFAGDADWCELRVTAKSTRYRSDNEEKTEDSIQRATFPEIIRTDTGKLYLTNRRLLFYGERGLRTIPLSRIVDFLPLEHGVHVQRKSGRNPFFSFDLGVDVFILMLARVLRDSSR